MLINMTTCFGHIDDPTEIPLDNIRLVPLPLCYSIRDREAKESNEFLTATLKLQSTAINYNQGKKVTTDNT